MDIVNKIKKFIEEECKKPTSTYGYSPFEFHFIPMVRYANELAEEYNADKEIVLLAAWLHDIGSIIYGRENHHITGVEIAEKKLKELNYPEQKIELIKKCIMNHRGSVPKKRESIEEQIIAEADALSNFDNITNLFDAVFTYEKLSRKDAEKSVREKLQRKWNQLTFEKSKERVKSKYDAAMLLLNGYEDI